MIMAYQLNLTLVSDYSDWIKGLPSRENEVMVFVLLSPVMTTHGSQRIIWIVQT